MKPNEGKHFTFCFVEADGKVEQASAELVDSPLYQGVERIYATLEFSSAKGALPSAPSHQTLAIAAETIGWLLEQELMLKKAHK